ncbi:lipo protein [Aspergillus sclerotioniger CBS 115572]|uniref:Lipo protein n=1 Tax=Aspergillus sclerotioniger CBS 115572 TaxID=1450535 RepID=A0A317W356_9EURO|nr:lipo protein [Aspergillus sclerotioniger CBS 115572]PWY80445.1 lipo protein [Aspergillus sclerotioniger CBS 115572]
MRHLSALTSLALGPYLLSSTGEASASPKSPPTPIIDRSKVVARFNPYRNASSTSTPMQTFLPYGTLSSWGWHNSSLPANSTPSDFKGVDWWTHGRLVNYDMPNPAEAGISQWLIANPHRINLGRIGFVFGGSHTNYTEDDLQEKSQVLDIYQGILESNFTLDGHATTVWTCVDPVSDTVAVRLQSELLTLDRLAIFFDYPYATDKNKFEAPFIGDWDAVLNHTTILHFTDDNTGAQIQHTLDNTTYYNTLQWSGTGASISRVGHSHRYVLQPNGSRTTEFEFTANFSPHATLNSSTLSADAITARSRQWWTAYWETGAFVDLTATGNATAVEIQRRVILSQYLLAVNEAGYDPPQESGRVNNGWYGKFHMEMYLWHAAHWTPWGKLSLLKRSIGVYDRFLPSSLERAADQGYKGLRLGKMSDPSGRSAPGEINALLIWQQPHVFYFAETEYQTIHSARGNTDDVLARWDYILTESAEFMASFAFWNASTNVYDLGPPMYPVSENTPPNSTRNPTFELAYWHFGLDVAISWKARLGQEAPSSWNHVKSNLASLPTVRTIDKSGDEVLTYTLYEGIPKMWTDPETVTDHPAPTGIYGLLSLSSVVNETIVAATAAKVASVWNFTDCWSWDFPMLAMNAARLGDVEAAIQYLVHSNFEFDDVGMPVGTKAPTPYFPGSAALLLAVAMMTGGWDVARNTSHQAVAPGFPSQWEVRAEGFERML